MKKNKNWQPYLGWNRLNVQQKIAITRKKNEFRNKNQFYFFLQFWQSFAVNICVSRIKQAFTLTDELKAARQITMFNNNFQNSSSQVKMENFSPKSSPRRVQDSSGTLKTKISLGKNPTIVHSGPFYLVKEPPEKSDLTGASNLISHYGLEHTYTKFNSKKVKEQLSSFLTNLACVIDGPGVIVSNYFSSLNQFTHGQCLHF